jgi:hypothetical protein
VQTIVGSQLFDQILRNMNIPGFIGKVKTYIENLSNSDIECMATDLLYMADDPDYVPTCVTLTEYDETA